VCIKLEQQNRELRIALAQAERNHDAVLAKLRQLEK
jgi:hypothetical protein